MSRLFSKSAISNASSLLQRPVTNTAAAFAASRPFVLRTRAPARGFRATSANMTVHNIQSAAEFEEALSKNQVVLVDFFATWCGPCKAIAPKVVEWSEKFPNIHYTKVDVDQLPEVSQKYDVRAMPTFLLFKNGEKVEEVVGANPPKLQALIEASHPSS